MFITLEIIYPLIDGSGITLLRVLVGLALWLVMGLAFGYILHLGRGSKSNIKNQSSEQ